MPMKKFKFDQFLTTTVFVITPNDVTLQEQNNVVYSLLCFDIAVGKIDVI